MLGLTNSDLRVSEIAISQPQNATPSENHAMLALNHFPACHACLAHSSAVPRARAPLMQYQPAPRPAEWNPNGLRADDFVIFQRIESDSNISNSCDC